MNNDLHKGKTITMACSTAPCKIVFATVLISLALTCFAQTPKWERLFQITATPEKRDTMSMVRWALPGGCFYYEAKVEDDLDNLDKHKQTYEWSGECIAGKPVDGPGELSAFIAYVGDEYVAMGKPAVGRMVNGRWDGVVRKTKYSFSYRNGCTYESRCRDLFNRLDASLGIKPAKGSFTPPPRKPR
ncbi:MAG: hypothetical protein V4607_08655 [Pseudomonadota bacterium]